MFFFLTSLLLIFWERVSGYLVRIRNPRYRKKRTLQTFAGDPFGVFLSEGEKIMMQITFFWQKMCLFSTQRNFHGKWLLFFDINDESFHGSGFKFGFQWSGDPPCPREDTN